MNAIGEHVLIRKPKRDEDGVKIVMPDNYEETFAYGRVVSIGDRVDDIVGRPGGVSVSLAENDIVVFDQHGSNALDLDGKKDAYLVVAHASQVYCTITEKELEARKLPIP